MSIYTRSQDGAIRQGEILANVFETKVNAESLRLGPDPDYEIKLHPLAIVVSQGCDLEWDFRARTPIVNEDNKNKLLPNILLCELWHASDLRGDQRLNAGLWTRITKNADERYHVLPPCPPDRDAAGLGLPEMAIDFKRVFAIGTEELYFRLSQETQRRAVLDVPYIQDLANRFGYFHLRVAIPEPLAAPGPVAGIAVANAPE